MKYFKVFIFLFLAVSCSSKAERKIVDSDFKATTEIPESNEEFVTSLVKLIANPEKYDGKIIRVIGYLNLEFEGNAIYLHKEDYEHGLTKNGFWLDFSGSIKENKKLDFSKKYVIIVGKFDVRRNGHMGLFGGTIKDISRLDIWR